MVVAGSVTVVANMPSSSNACSVGGSANVYQLDVCTGSFINSGSAERIDGEVVAGRTLSATSAAVGFIMIRLPSGILKMVTTTADGRNSAIALPGGKALRSPGNRNRCYLVPANHLCGAYQD